MNSHLEPIKIVYLIANLSGGGAERALLTQAEFFSQNGCLVEILTLQPPQAAYPVTLSPTLQIRPLKTAWLGQKLGWAALVPQALELALRLSRSSAKCCHAFMYRSNFTALLSRLFGHRVAIFVSEHVNAESHYGKSRLGRCFLGLVGRVYGFADGIQVVSQGLIPGLVRLGIDPQQISWIPNPISFEEITARSSEAHPLRDWIRRAPTLVNVGRLTYQKDQGHLIDAVAQLPGVQLLLIGQGPDEEALRKQVHRLGLSERVHFALWQDNPYALMAECAAFVLSSRYEGFGVVLIEAMALGLPVISTDCPDGPSEILEGGRWGSLVPIEDPDALVAALRPLLECPEERSRWSQLARERAQKYDTSSVCRSLSRFLRGLPV